MKLRWLIFLSSFLLLFAETRVGVCEPIARSFVYPFASSKAYSDVWPLSVSYTEPQRHYGVDYPCAEGTPVYASTSGTVIEASDGETGKTCIAHGNTILIKEGRHEGCTVRYSHLLYDSIPFEVGDYVYAGQLVGLTSNTGNTFSAGGTCIPNTSGGYHLHYEVRCNGSTGLNPYAPGLYDHPNDAPGKDMFIVDNDGSYHFPGEPLFGFANHPVTICANEPDHNEYWFYDCTEKNIFKEGDQAWALLRLYAVDVDHAFKVKAYKDDVFQWEWTTDVNDVGDDLWFYSHFWPDLTYAYPGEWKLDLFFLLEEDGDGDGMEESYGEVYVDTAEFIVYSQGEVSIPIEDKYEYDGNAITCGDEPDGSAATNWWYTCSDQRTAFEQGEDVYGLIRIDNPVVNHRFKVTVFHNGMFESEWQTNWNDVGDWGWDKAFFWNVLPNAPAGSWSFNYYIDIGNGFNPLGSQTFAVSPSDAPYDYYGDITLCTGPIGGDASTDWFFTCLNPTSSFVSGQSAIALIRIDNIHADHRWKVQVYVDEVFQWAYQTEWNVVGFWGWDKTYFWPTTGSVWPGSWEYRIFLDTGGYEGFRQIESVNFMVY